jgi:hypothetical protein
MAGADGASHDGSDGLHPREASPSAEGVRARDPGLTVRAVSLALVLIFLLLVAAFYLEFVTKLAYSFTTLVPPVAPLGVLFLLALLNPRLARRRGLSRRELLVVYGLVTIGAPLMAHGILMWFLSSTIGWQYYAQVNPQWAPTFLPGVPTWFSPTDAVSVDGFFQGRTPVPWSAWWTPLAAWGGFFLALFLANLCLLLLLKRQWINNERLTFPVAQIPLEAVREDAAGRGRLSTASMFWFGFGGAVLLSLQSRLPSIFPSLPSLNLNGITLVPWQRIGPLAGLGEVQLLLYPAVIALAYLVPKELSFSGWFFYGVRVVLTVIAIAAGAAPQRPEDFRDTSFPAPEFQGGGAVLAIGLLALWSGRHYLAQAVRDAFRRPDAGEGREPAASRGVMLGLLLAVAYLVGFCCWAGARPGVALALIGLTLFYHMVWARLRAENGMAFIAFPLSVNEMLIRPFGTGAFRPREIMTILATRWAYWPGWGETCEVVTGASLDTLKLADATRLNTRRMALVMIGVFGVALGAGIFLALTGVYRYGFIDLQQSGSWVDYEVQRGGSQIYDALTNPGSVSPSAIAAIGSGLLITLALSALRLRFLWWPLHPVGYVVANVWGSQWWWGPLFVAWLLKSLVIRYGGLRLYQKTVPLAIGVIVGNQLTDTLWPLGLWLARRYG